MSVERLTKQMCESVVEGGENRCRPCARRLSGVKKACIAGALELRNAWVESTEGNM